MENSQYLGTERVGKLLRQFAVPCICSLIISYLYNIVDQIFVGNGIGYLGNAATGVIFPITVVGWGLSLFFGDGAAAMLSVSLGREETKDIHRSVGSAIFGVMVAVIAYLWGDGLLRLIGATDANLQMAHDYGVIIFAMMPLAMTQNALASIIRADGSPQYAMASMLTGAVINIIGDPMAIFVLDMGIQGAAWATILGQFVSFVICAAYLGRSKNFRIEGSSFKPSAALLKPVMALGTSSLLTQLSIVIITVVNDLYNRDSSKKVLTGWMARSRQGKFMGGPPPYGLRRDPEDHGHLIIDPKTAPTVKLVFDLALNGCGTMKIAKHLLEHKIPITCVKTPVESEVRYFSWSGSVVGKMLRNPVYKGDHVVCKAHQKAIRSNTINAIPRDQWEIVENCHEAIVSREQWDRVQTLIDRRPPIMQGNRCPFYNLFHGLVYCATCGKSMQVRYEKAGRMDVNRITKKKREPIDKAYYICQTYNRLGKNACTSHKIEARDLYNLVLSDIMAHAAMALKDAEGFYRRLTGHLEEQYTLDENGLKRELEALTKRNQEIDDMFMSLYADKTKGILTEQRFLRMTETLEQEQHDNKARMQDITDELRIASSAEDDVRWFIGEIQAYASITELDEAILNRLIDKIYISTVEVIDGEKVQKVRIVYNFVVEIEN